MGEVLYVPKAQYDSKVIELTTDHAAALADKDREIERLKELAQTAFRVGIEHQNALTAAQQQIKTLREALEDARKVISTFRHNGSNPHCDTCRRVARIDAALAATVPKKEGRTTPPPNTNEPGPTEPPKPPLDRWVK